jgi:hypothetical protein
VRGAALAGFDEINMFAAPGMLAAKTGHQLSKFARGIPETKTHARRGAANISVCRPARIIEEFARQATEIVFCSNNWLD